MRDNPNRGWSRELAPRASDPGGSPHGGGQRHQKNRNCLHLFVPRQKPLSNGFGDNKFSMLYIVHRVCGIQTMASIVRRSGVRIGKNK